MEQFPFSAALWRGDRPATIKTITIDFWGTIVVDGPSMDDRYKKPRLDGFERILHAAGVRVSAAALSAAYDESLRSLGKLWSTNRDVPVDGHVEAVLGALPDGIADGLGSGVRAALVEAYATPMERVPPTLDRGARAALATLRGRGYALAVVSNVMRTPGQILRRVLAGYGLLPLFAATVFSDEVGVRKPAPEIFAITLEQLGTSAAAAVHVGDDLVLDVMGARHAGLRTVHVQGNHDAGVGPVRPDRTITSLAELPSTIARLEAEAR